MEEKSILSPIPVQILLAQLLLWMKDRYATSHLFLVLIIAQVLASPMLSSTASGAGTLLMAALAAVTSVDMGLAHFVIVSNESTQLRQLLKGNF